MPVSHLGLTVSHIPSARCFYQSALEPLGYHYAGQRGDSIGFGITEADFFLRQGQQGHPTAPTHIAFAASDRLAVRECYTAALNAGATPSGAPRYREDDCSCFNAAVVDFDGNTVEFIHRETVDAGYQEDFSARSIPQARRFSSPENVARNPSTRRGSMSEYPPSSRTQSRYQTAVDLAKATGKSMKVANEPTPGMVRAHTEPVREKSNGKALMGTLMGVAAGAAFLYATYSTERENAREEAVYSAMANGKKPRPSSARSRQREVEITESLTTRRLPHHHSPARISPRAIEAPRLDEQSVGSTRHTSTRHPPPARSRTYDNSSVSTASRDRFTVQRAHTLPEQGDRSTVSSRHTSRRGSIDDRRSKRHDSIIGPSTRSSRRQSSAGRHGSSVSTIKPSRRSSVVNSSAANVPLPPSIAGTYVTAAEVPIPASRYSSHVSATSRPRRNSTTTYIYTDRAWDTPTHQHRDELDDENDVPRQGEESDGIDDSVTVVPDDSISCVDFSEYRERQGKKTKSKTYAWSEAVGGDRNALGSVRDETDEKYGGRMARTVIEMPVRVKGSRR